MATLTLYINILSFILAFIGCYFSFKKSNLIAVLYWICLNVLVVGQAIHISMSLEESDYVYYVWNFISQSGHLWASVCLLYVIVITQFLSLAIKQKKFFDKQYILKYWQYKGKELECFFFYTFEWIFLVFITAVAINIVGGLNMWMLSDRPVASGSTFLIIGMGLAAYPLLFKIIEQQKPNVNDTLLFVGSTIAVLSFSRFLALFRLLILFLCYIYSQGASEVKKAKNYFFIFLFVFGAIYFVYGTYRHVVPYIDDYSINGFSDYISENSDNTLFSLDVNYRVAIEGMSGFSGAVTESLDNEEINVDLGISLLEVFFKLVPSFLFRDELIPVIKDLHSLFWYHGSVVPGGLESFFVHFWFLGIIIYPFIIYIFAYQIHHKLTTSLNMNIKLKFTYIIAAIYGLLIIKGSTYVFLFYIICELIILNIAYLLQNMLFKGVRRN